MSTRKRDCRGRQRQVENPPQNLTKLEKVDLITEMHNEDTVESNDRQDWQLQFRQKVCQMPRSTSATSEPKDIASLSKKLDLLIEMRNEDRQRDEKWRQQLEQQGWPTAKCSVRDSREFSIMSEKLDLLLSIWKEDQHRADQWKQRYEQRERHHKEQVGLLKDLVAAISSEILEKPKLSNE